MTAYFSITFKQLWIINERKNKKSQMNKQRNTILPHFWVSSEFERKKLEETVSSRRKKPWKKPWFFPLWKKLANPAQQDSTASGLSD